MISTHCHSSLHLRRRDARCSLTLSKVVHVSQRTDWVPPVHRTPIDALPRPPWQPSLIKQSPRNQASRPTMCLTLRRRSDGAKRVIRVYFVASVASLLKTKGAFAQFVERVERARVPIVGLDAEWEKDRPMSLLQLATPQECFIFQLLRRPKRHGTKDHIASVPLPLISYLVTLLQNPGIVKSGVGVTKDAGRLKAERSIDTARCFDVDIGALCFGQGTRGHTEGLQSLSKHFAKLTLKKDATCSMWEDHILTRKQLRYAAMDAVGSAAVGVALRERFFRAREAAITTPPPSAPNYLQEWLHLSERPEVAFLSWVSDQEQRGRGSNKERNTSLSVQRDVDVLNPLGQLVDILSLKRAKQFVQRMLAEWRPKGSVIVLLSMPAKLLEICERFERGECRCGDHCIYQHPLSPP